MDGWMEGGMKEQKEGLLHILIIQACLNMPSSAQQTTKYCGAFAKSVCVRHTQKGKVIKLTNYIKFITTALMQCLCLQADLICLIYILAFWLQHTTQWSRVQKLFCPILSCCDIDLDILALSQPWTPCQWVFSVGKTSTYHTKME